MRSSGGARLSASPSAISWASDALSPPPSRMRLHKKARRLSDEQTTRSPSPRSPSPSGPSTQLSEDPEVETVDTEVSVRRRSRTPARRAVAVAAAVAEDEDEESEDEVDTPPATRSSPRISPLDVVFRRRGTPYPAEQQQHDDDDDDEDDAPTVRADASPARRRPRGSGERAAARKRAMKNKPRAAGLGAAGDAEIAANWRVWLLAALAALMLWRASAAPLAGADLAELWHEGECNHAAWPNATAPSVRCSGDDEESRCAMAMPANRSAVLLDAAWRETTDMLENLSLRSENTFSWMNSRPLDK